ncbi:mannitol dehydrogenase family protein [Waltera acetigignens]|uniref:mannitol dehydrogenase family protein n=1 Tax=Waltera acetigignens TaxID=2981769 RepID=UPI0021D05F76|nr:mannitol dehydrogenase family protein [Brotolimicola acetigignens]MCU6757092.1 mannitol dehydrogenase family protein [Brotolimicola acetigignens]
MELTLKSLHDDRDAFLAAGYHLPEFDYDTVHKNTVEHPHWIHFGAGNIFRAFQANVAQNLLNSGVLDTGLIAAEGYDYEIIEKSYRPHDNLSILATLKADNTVEKTIVGSIMESLILDSKNEAEYARLREIFKNPSLQMASFTITEKGYATANAKGEFFPAVAADFEKGPEAPESYLGKIVSLLYTRYTHGALPIAMVSMDNCSHNGDKLYAAVNAFAKAWTDNGLVEAGFLGYVNDQTKVTFPWSMIDKITPRPDAKVEAMLAEDHIGGLDAVVTSKNTYIAPFVNAEECEYLVIEDAFPNGKPALDKGGIIFTDRATVDKVEKMKVCTCLNPLHTALAIYGCLLGYTLISEEMKNPLLKNMVEVIGYKEGLPVVVNPGILDPKKFIDEVVNVRIPNPFLPDSPQRIATDTSQKLSIRFGETIKAYEASPDLHTEDLKLIPLVYAGWLRYLMGIDDEGREFTPSSDPLLEEARQYVADYELSSAPKDLSKLDALLANEKIFGVNLHAIGMDTLVKQYFAELSSGMGAVAAALKKYVPEKVTL